MSCPAGDRSTIAGYLTTLVGTCDVPDLWVTPPLPPGPITADRERAATPLVIYRWGYNLEMTERRTERIGPQNRVVLGPSAPGRT